MIAKTIKFPVETKIMEMMKKFKNNDNIFERRLCSLMWTRDDNNKLPGAVFYNYLYRAFGLKIASQNKAKYTFLSEEQKHFFAKMLSKIWDNLNSKFRKIPGTMTICDIEEEFTAAELQIIHKEQDEHEVHEVHEVHEEHEEHDVKDSEFLKYNDAWIPPVGTKVYFIKNGGFIEGVIFPSNLLNGKDNCARLLAPRYIYVDDYKNKRFIVGSPTDTASYVNSRRINSGWFYWKTNEDLIGSGVLPDEIKERIGMALFLRIKKKRGLLINGQLENWTELPKCSSFTHVKNSEKLKNVNVFYYSLQTLKKEVCQPNDANIQVVKENVVMKFVTVWEDVRENKNIQNKMFDTEKNAKLSGAVIVKQRVGIDFGNGKVLLLDPLYEEPIKIQTIADLKAAIVEKMIAANISTDEVNLLVGMTEEELKKVFNR